MIDNGNSNRSSIGVTVIVFYSVQRIAEEQ